MNPKPLPLSLGVKLIDVPMPERMAGLMVVSAELEHLRSKLGYALGWQSVGKNSRSTWEVFCAREAGMTPSTKKNWLRNREVVMARLRAVGGAEELALVALMEQAPSALTPEQRRGMVAGIARMCEGESWTSLQAAWRALKAPQPVKAPPAAPAVAHPAAPAMDAAAVAASMPYLTPAAREVEAMALACGVAPERARQIARAVTVRKHLATIREIRSETNGHNLQS